MKDADIVVLAYAINSRRSFDKLSEYVEIIKDCAEESKIVLVGLKFDLEGERAIPKIRK